MRVRAFAVLDQKAKAFLPPIFYPEVGQAVRVFSDCVNDKTHPFGLHPEDYVLYEIGLYDDAKALLEAYGPEMVITGMQVVAEATVISDAQGVLALASVGGDS